MVFYNDGENFVDVDTMYQEKYFIYGESSDLDSKVLEMDYIGNEISFVIVLPNERNGLNSLKRKINSKSFSRVLKTLRCRKTKVWLPKFKIEKSYYLTDEINPKPIALTRNANFSGLTSYPMFVSKIKHKVFIDVSESGVEGGAATSVEFYFLSTRPIEVFEFRADHPLLL